MITDIENTTSSNQVIEQISVSKLDAIIDEKKFTLIDVRPPAGVEKQGSIPGAINIPLEELKHQVSHRAEHPESIWNEEGPFLFCCTGGVMSYMAAIHAQENGITGIHNLEGGHSAWVKLKECYELS